jgi:cytochrome c-type biogenesis protein CcmH/NrfG
MSRQFARLMQHRTKRRKGDTAQLAAQLAPLEEQNKAVAAQQGAVAQSSAQAGMHHERGAIVVDTDNLIIPKDVSDPREKAFWRIEPVVIVIVVLMLLFIAFVAWQISQSPWPPPKLEG